MAEKKKSLSRSTSKCAILVVNDDASKKRISIPPSELVQPVSLQFLLQAILLGTEGVVGSRGSGDGGFERRHFRSFRHQQILLHLQLILQLPEALLFHCGGVGGGERGRVEGKGRKRKR